VSERKKAGAAPDMAEMLPRIELLESDTDKYTAFRFYDIYVNGEETNLWLGITTDKDITIDGVLMKGVRFKVGKYGYYQRARK
jgi:hypothetical protein